MRALWNRPWYKTIIIYTGIYGKLWQHENIFHRRTDVDMDQKRFSFPGHLILKSVILLTYCGSKLSHWHFRQPHGGGGRGKSPSISQLARHGVRHREQWLFREKRIRSVFQGKYLNKDKVQMWTMQRGRLVDSSFIKLADKKLHFWRVSDVTLEKWNSQT
jgi:hypothetical protein